MSNLKIIGGNFLKGEISVSGSKNAALPIMCCSLLNPNKITLNNIPKITDVYELLKIFSYLDVKYTFNKNLIILKKDLKYKDLIIDQISNFRASYYLMGVYLYLFGKCTISLPGGCNLGKRPLDYHFAGFEKLGYNVKINNNIVYINQIQILKNQTIVLKKPSVGATINLLLAGLKNGVTIVNYSKEPEVIDTISFLNKCGFKITYKDNLYVDNNFNVKTTTYKIIPDRIEAATYIIMALLCGKITITNVNISHLDNIIKPLILHNGKINIEKNKLIVSKSKILPFNFKTDYYPGISTDIQPLLGVLLLLNKNNVIIKDSIFENRFNYLNQLKNIGANVSIKPPYAYLYGGCFFDGVVDSCDLRAAAALTIAALAIKCTTTITNIEIIKRGYSNFYQNLINLGANIKIENCNS